MTGRTVGIGTLRPMTRVLAFLTLVALTACDGREYYMGGSKPGDAEALAQLRHRAIRVIIGGNSGPRHSL
jgi:hypothetical protein